MTDALIRCATLFTHENYESMYVTNGKNALNSVICNGTFKSFWIKVDLNLGIE